MAGIRNISRIVMDYMNSMIALSKAYRDNNRFIHLVFSNKTEVFVRKGDITEISKIMQDDKPIYSVKTEFNYYKIDEKQYKELVNNW